MTTVSSSFEIDLCLNWLVSVWGWCYKQKTLLNIRVTYGRHQDSHILELLRHSEGTTDSAHLIWGLEKHGLSCWTAKGMFHAFSCLAHTQQPRTTPCAPGESETKCDEREDPTTLMPSPLYWITENRVLVVHQLLPWVMIAGCSGTLWRWCTRRGLVSLS